MTRRGRLARLEARRKEGAGDMVGIFEADLQAGLWREAGGQGRTLPLSPEDFGEGGRLEGAGGALLMLAPAGGSKVIANVTAADL